MCHIVSIKKIDVYIVTDSRKASKVPLLCMYDVRNCVEDLAP